jgi:hypothetical protein
MFSDLNHVLCFGGGVLLCHDLEECFIVTERNEPKFSKIFFPTLQDFSEYVRKILKFSDYKVNEQTKKIR